MVHLKMVSLSKGVTLFMFPSKTVPLKMFSLSNGTFSFPSHMVHLYNCFLSNLIWFPSQMAHVIPLKWYTILKGFPLKLYIQPCLTLKWYTLPWFPSQMVYLTMFFLALGAPYNDIHLKLLLKSIHKSNVKFQSIGRPTGTRSRMR